MKKELEVIRLNEANKFLEKSLVFLHEEDRIVVEKIINSYKDSITEYHTKELTVINPTKTELGIVRSTLKKRVINYIAGISSIEYYGHRYSDIFLEHICDGNDYCSLCEEEYKKRESFYKKKNDLIVKIRELCDKTKLSEELVSSKILLHRKNTNYYSYNKLEQELNEFIKTKMLEQFIEQNKWFIEEIIKNKTK